MEGLLNQAKTFAFFLIGDEQPLKSLSEEGHGETWTLGRSQEIHTGIDWSRATAAPGGDLAKRCLFQAASILWVVLLG